MRQDPSTIIKNEDGSALIFAILILALLTLIGISATTTSTIEVQIAGNDKFHKMAFYGADSGVYTIPKVISRALDEHATPGNLVNHTYGAFTYLDTGTDDDGSSGSTFYRELAGFAPNDTSPDIKFALGGDDVEVDVERDRAENLVGGGAEFASGSEGLGAGSTGGVAIFYDLDSFGSGPSNSLSNIGAVYRKVVGTAGGL